MGREPDRRTGGSGDGPAAPDRRRLLKGALGTAPLVLSLKARPVLGSGGCTVSGLLSGNLSGPAPSCEGCTPGYWKTHRGSWPAPYEPGTCGSGKGKGMGMGMGAGCNAPGGWSGGTRFADVFGMAGLAHFALSADTVDAIGGDVSMLTLMQVLWLGGDEDPYRLGAHAVAALLNAAHGGVSFGYTPGEIIDLFDAGYATDPEGTKNGFQLLNEQGCPL